MSNDDGSTTKPELARMRMTIEMTRDEVGTLILEAFGRTYTPPKGRRMRVEELNGSFYSLSDRSGALFAIITDEPPPKPPTASTAFGSVADAEAAVLEPALTESAGSGMTVTSSSTDFDDDIAF